MLQAANTDPLVPELMMLCQNLPFSLQNKPVSQLKLIGGFLFFSPVTNGFISQTVYQFSQIKPLFE